MGVQESWQELEDVWLLLSRRAAQGEGQSPPVPTGQLSPAQEHWYEPSTGKLEREAQCPFEDPGIW